MVESTNNAVDPTRMVYNFKRIITVDDVLQATHEKFPDLDVWGRGIFLLKLDIEGLEPTVLRWMVRTPVPVKLLSPCLPFDLVEWLSVIACFSVCGLDDICLISVVP